MSRTYVFEIFRDGRGRWRARRSDGLVDGLFVDQISAVRFARRESPDGRLLIRP
ncbi:MAG TPA: hypothetical protein VNX61_14830 [Rhizomicrobium sp.]|jgi:hypothetical protein|nr:hypothetical protein [Rhizomicrobium sp.]